jgi:hypothetical protein
MSNEMKLFKPMLKNFFFPIHFIPWMNIVTDLLKPCSTINLEARCSACLAQLYLGSVLRNSV